MSTSHLVHLHVRPYINKFLLAKCGDPDRVVHTSCGLELMKMMTVHLAPYTVVGLRNVFLENGGRPSGILPVELRGNQPPAFGPSVHTRVSLEAEEIFRRDLCNYVLHIRHHKNIEKNTAILRYLQLNGIADDDDLQFQSARRIFWKFERAMAGNPVRERPRPWRTRYR